MDGINGALDGSLKLLFALIVEAPADVTVDTFNETAPCPDKRTKNDYLCRKL